VADENLKFRKPHMTFVDGYFYTFDEDTDMLLAKSDDGATAFSYPFDTLLTSSITSLEYDGINFWTMEDGVNSSLIIKRWRIENYMCCLKQIVNLENAAITYDASAFTVEHYHCTISGSYSSGEYSIFLNEDFPGDLESGMTITLISNSDVETIVVQDTNSYNNEIVLADPLENSYEEGDTLLFFNYLWVFNNANGNSVSTGALYKISAYSGIVVQKFPSGAYKDVTACTFSEVDHFTEFGAVNSLMFVKASNLLFINISETPLKYYGSMAMDTIEANNTTIITVYDIAIFNKNLYRLQKKATYYGSTSAWAEYSYQPATFNQMVASISITASPNVIAANQVSTADLKAKIRDQFGQPVQSKLVYFEDDDGDGSIISGAGGTNTNELGEAVAVYKSGLSARLVKITATVNQ